MIFLVNNNVFIVLIINYEISEFYNQNLSLPLKIFDELYEFWKIPKKLSENKNPR